MTAFPEIKTVYRLLLPLAVGTLVYLTVLLAFDTVANVTEDFFTNELLFCIICSYVLLEANRALLVLFGKQLVRSSRFLHYAYAMVSCAVILSIGIISLMLISYFYWFENMTDASVYTTELKIFNGIFLIVTLLFQSHFLGFHLIHKRFEKEMEKERFEKESLDRNVDLFNYMLNPQFLFLGLESVLLLLKEKKYELADHGILILSDIYRYSLQPQDELVSLNEELHAMERTELFLNRFVHRYISVTPPTFTNPAFLLVPRTLTTLLEAIAHSQLSTSSFPLEINLEIRNDKLEISFPSNFSLTSGDQLYETLKEVQRQYLWLDKHIEWTENGTFFIFIPMEKPYIPSEKESKSTTSLFQPHSDESPIDRR